MTAEEFERQYAERCGISIQHLRDLGRVVHPCDCDWEGCEGWQSLSHEAANDVVDDG